MPIKNRNRVAELAAHGLSPRPPDGASRLFPPPLQRLRIHSSVPLAESRRALRTLGVFFLTFSVSLVFADARDPGGAAPDRMILAMFALSGLLPAWVWVRSRYVSNGTQALRGYVPGLLGSVPVLAEGFRTTVWRALDDRVTARDLLPLPDGPAVDAPLSTSASRDLAFEVSGLRVKSRSPGNGEGTRTVSARRAVQSLCWLLADTLGVRPSQVRAMYPLVGDSADGERQDCIDFVMVVVLGGQRFGTDVVCQAIHEAAATLCLAHEFLIEAPQARR